MQQSPSGVLVENNTKQCWQAPALKKILEATKTMGDAKKGWTNHSATAQLVSKIINILMDKLK